MLNSYILGANELTTAGDAIASIQLPRKGVIKRIDVAVTTVANPSTAGLIQIQASQRPNSNFNAIYNQPSGSLAFNQQSCVANGVINIFESFNLACPVNPNDVIYLHSTIAGTGFGYSATYTIWVQE